MQVVVVYDHCAEKSSMAIAKYQNQNIDTSYKVQIINGLPERIYTIVVHKFEMGDVEDPILYAAQPLYEWEKSEKGKWVMAHAITPPIWQKHESHLTMTHVFIIIARLRGRDHTFYQLKWGSK